MSERVVSASRLIPAPPEQIFELLARPEKHSVIDGSGMVQSSRSGVDLITGTGQKFGMDMKMGPIPYRISNTVVEFEQDRLIAWRHFGRHIWRWQLEPAEGGTQVTESFDWSGAVFPPALEWAGYPKKNLAAMEATLERLEQHFSK